MRRVVIESPYKGDVARNLAYLERCIADCLQRGEAPYASHKLLTTVLDDTVLAERLQGIRCQLAWIEACDYVAIYMDYGITSGMQHAIDCCETLGVQTVKRAIGVNS